MARRPSARCADLQPDVVVVDLVMPGMDGVEVIRALREHPTIGLLALSSFTELERIREVIRAGANGYLVKSVDAESLAEAVRSAAAGPAPSPRGHTDHSSAGCPPRLAR